MDDAGVDLSLEILVNGTYTNFRSQVQLKSTESKQPNRDGSIFVQVESSNLNYLLQGANPLYVLYISPNDELRFVWAWDERKRLEEENPNWSKQSTITIKFQDALTTEALEQIYNQVIARGRFDREINERLGRGAPSEQLIAIIDRETLKIDDPETLKERLMINGFALVTSGYADHVIDSIALLGISATKRPRIQLIRAYAEHTLGRHLSAISSLADVGLNVEELTPEEQRFLSHLRLACEYQTGRVSFAEYQNLLAKTEVNPSDGFAISHYLNQLGYELLDERNHESRKLRLDWCQYLDLDHDKRHQRNLITYFREDPLPKHTILRLDN